MKKIKLLAFIAVMSFANFSYAQQWMVNDMSWTQNDPAWRSNVNSTPGYDNTYILDGTPICGSSYCRWASTSSTGWVIIDFGSDKSISQLRINNNTQTNQQPKSCRLQYSNSFSGPWTTASSYTCNNVGGTWEYFPSFSTTTARYWKLVIDNSYGSRFQIAEIEFYQENICGSDTIINDTIVNYVSNIDFELESPKIYYDSTDTISYLNSSCDSVITNHYTKYLFEANHCSDSITVNDTIWHNDTIWTNDTIWHNDTIWVNETIYDTTYTEINDTVLISVDDTLIINYKVTDIQDQLIGETSTFKLYPNPTINLLHVEIENSTFVNGYTIDIYSIGGVFKESQTINSSSMSFDLDGYAKGTYVFYLKRNDQIMETKKIIIK